MNYWSFAATQQQIDGGIATAKEIVARRIADGFWGLAKNAPNGRYLQKGDQVVFYLGSPRIYDATIAEHRLPLANAKILLQRSREVGVSDDFRARFSRVVEVMETIDAYMSMGEEKLNKWTSNLRSYTEELHELARKLKEDQLR